MPQAGAHAELRSAIPHLVDRTVITGLIALAAAIVWRAATQAITYDEAFTWLAFVRGPFDAVLTRYTANNHVLFSAAAWTTTHALGASELTLRMPTLVAAGAYLAASRALGRTLCGPGALAGVVTAALVLNPFVLDFLVAARGYGLATAALLLAILAALRVDGRESVRARWRLCVVGLALGLSVSANLAFLFPAAGTVLTVTALAGLGARTARGRSAVMAGLSVMVPMLAVAAPLLAGPLTRARREHFFYGTDSLAQTSVSLVEASLQYDTLGRWHVSDATVRLVALVVVPLALGVWVVAATANLHLRWRRGAHSPLPARSTDGLSCVGGVLGTTLLLVSAAHALADVRLPLERSGLYFLPLFVLGMAASIRALSRPGPAYRAARAALAAALAALVVAYGAQFTTTHFRTWRFDAGSREVFERVASWPCPTDRPRRLTTTPWMYEPALEFYRVIRRANHIVPLDTDHESFTPGDADFYVLASPEEVAALSGLAVTAMTHPVSGARLLVARDLASCPPVPDVGRL